MIRGLRVSEEEFHALVVNDLELVNQAEFDNVRAMTRRLRIPLERALLERNRIPYHFLLEQFAASWDVGFIDLKISQVKRDALLKLPEQFARTNMIIPFDVAEKILRVAMWDPRDKRVLQEMKQRTGMEIEPYLAPEQSIQRAFLLYSGDLRDMLQQTREGEVVIGSTSQRPGEEEKSATKLFERMIQYAVISRASDIHVEPSELEGYVRYRIDGVLHDVLRLTVESMPGLVARIKILSGMRIDEKRAPQDGRYQADLGGFQVDLRVSSVPTFFGEKIVLRVLTKESIPLALEDLGLTNADFQIVLRNILLPYGMILVTGPTGSGKSSSLYAMIIRLAAERHSQINISTIEDPVEYTIPRIAQIPINPAAGVDFAAGLRALLRQDPDVIMVGEIRDRETADMAVRAAMVGRLLLSTLHTNDAAGAIPRLVDIGVEPYLLASTMALIIGQRLVRRICTRCRESYQPDAALLSAISRRPDFEETVQILRREGVLQSAGDPLAGIRFYRGRGCPYCNEKGFLGRTGIFELFEVSDEIRGMIMERQSGAALRRQAISQGMKTMYQDGMAKVLLGETTMEELNRVVMSDSMGAFSGNPPAHAGRKTG
jgi:type IV pilus assembly protein PilB